MTRANAYDDAKFVFVDNAKQGVSRKVGGIVEVNMIWCRVVLVPYSLAYSEEVQSLPWSLKHNGSPNQRIHTALGRINNVARFSPWL